MAGSPEEKDRIVQYGDGPKSLDSRSSQALREKIQNNSLADYTVGQFPALVRAMTGKLISVDDALALGQEIDPADLEPQATQETTPRPVELERRREDPKNPYF